MKINKRYKINELQTTEEFHLPIGATPYNMTCQYYHCYN